METQFHLCVFGLMTTIRKHYDYMIRLLVEIKRRGENLHLNAAASSTTMCQQDIVCASSLYLKLVGVQRQTLFGSKATF